MRNRSSHLLNNLPQIFKNCEKVRSHLSDQFIMSEFLSDLMHCSDLLEKVSIDAHCSYDKNIIGTMMYLSDIYVSCNKLLRQGKC